MSRRTTHQALQLEWVKSITCIVSIHLSCRFVSIKVFKQCCRSALYFLFRCCGVMFLCQFITFIPCGMCRFGDANNCRGDLVVGIVYIRCVWLGECRQHVVSLMKSSHSAFRKFQRASEEHGVGLTRALCLIKDGRC